MERVKFRKEITPVSDTVVNLGDGTFYYNYNVQVSSEQMHDMHTDEMKDVDVYTYIQVMIRGEVTYEKCVKAIIREYLSVDNEFDIINSANRDLLDGRTDTESITRYRSYLSLLDEIKYNVKKDLGIL